MKKFLTAIVCVFMAFLTLGVTGCEKPTKAYLDFYNSIKGATYEVDVPEGYEDFEMEVNAINDYFRFYIITSNKGSLFVFVDEKPSKGINISYREKVVDEKMATICYRPSTVKVEVGNVYFNSEIIQNSHHAYNETVEKAEAFYADILPVVNSVIAQISGGKYTSIDDFYKI